MFNKISQKYSSVNKIWCNNHKLNELLLLTIHSVCLTPIDQTVMHQTELKSRRIFQTQLLNAILKDKDNLLTKKCKIHYQPVLEKRMK